MSVRLSRDAEEQAELCDAWWRTHRQDAVGLFAQELAATASQLATTPKIGIVWAVVRGKPVRRFLMPVRGITSTTRSRRETGDIVIHAIWGAPRQGGPNL